MLRRRARNRPILRGRARSRGPLFVVALLLGAVVTQASQAQEAAPAERGGADAGPGPIDTSITVQSNRATKPPADSARTKSTSGAQMPRQQPFSNPGDRAMPNAVGFPVARPGPPPAAPGVPPPGSQPPIMSARPNAPAGLAGASAGFAHQAAINRSAISGTGLTRPGAGPGMVQGSPKSLGTVSGTSLHSKR